MKMQFALMSQTFDVYVVFCVRLEWNSIFFANEVEFGILLK